MCCSNKNLFLIASAVIGISDDFDSDTTASWISVGATATTIEHDPVSDGDYDDGNAAIRLAYTSGMFLTGDGVKDDGGLRLDSQNATPGDEAMGLTVSGTMTNGEMLVFSGSVYNDQSSFCRYKAQLWNLTDGGLLNESAITTVQGYTHVAYVPVGFSVAYTATAADEGDTLQLRFIEDNNNTERDIFVDNLTLTTSTEPPPVYEHPRLFFSTNDLAALQAQRLTTHSDEWAQLISTCNNLNGTTPTTTPRTATDLLGYEDKIVALALVPLIDPSLGYQATSENWFWTILNWTEWGSGYWSWPDYGPHGNLETGEILRALAIWYDLQYHNLTPTERIDAGTKLADYADRFRNSYERFRTTDNGELTGNHCWNAFAAVSAVLYASDEVSPARQANWTSLLNGHYNTISNLMDTVMSDGSTGEGFTYWTYGIEKLLLWFETRRVGGDPAFDGIDWFENTGTYGIFGIMPGGTDNYGGISRYDDADPDYWGNPYNEIALLAKATQDPVAQWMANELDHSGSTKKNAYRYMFYDAMLPSINPETDLNNWHFFDDYGFFFWRTSWANTAQHFTMRSGQHSHGHSKGDDGQFMLSRSGVPYIVNLGYAVPRYAKDCNVLLVDGTGQYSDGDDWGTVFNTSWPGNSNTWGKTLHVLANSTDYQTGDFFNVLIDPTPMYTSSKLSSWQREVVGLGGDLYLLRDDIATTSSANLDLQLHGLVTAASGDTYSENSTSNPWSSTGAGKWDLTARSGTPTLKVQDLSGDSWSSVIEETWFYYKNSVLTRRGNNLKRSRTGTAGTSLISFGFDDLMTGWTQTAWTNATAEGCHVVASGSPVIDVLWPLNGASVSGSDGWSVTGKMAGRRFGDSFFGREVTAVQYNGLSLLSATTPVSFHAKTEQVLGGTVPNRMVVSSDAPASLTLYSPHEPETVLLNDLSVAFSWAGQQLAVTVPAGTNSTIDLVDPAYLGWRDLHFSPAEIASGLAGLGLDSDADGATNWDEYIADTNPRSDAEFFVAAITPILVSGNQEISFATSSNRMYGVDYRTNLLSGTWTTLTNGLSGTGGILTITDSNKYENCFYRSTVMVP
ncbi:MAG: heparinase II/III family protein [Verrucomicrobia bacterium]|nr:heparinase II/III family protein [Verrucomicrobiota bacterium]